MSTLVEHQHHLLSSYSTFDTTCPPVCCPAEPSVSEAGWSPEMGDGG